MIDLKELRRLAEAASKGDRFTYIDTDYYRGGLYLGIGPKRYVHKSKGEYISVSPEEATSAEKTIAILESEVEDTDYLIAVSNPQVMIELLDERAKLINLLKHSRRFCEIYEGWGASFDALDEATEACADIKIEEVGE